VPELRTMAKMRGWELAPYNDDDGVAAVLEEAMKRRASEVDLTSLG
jgi:hypothetical protein